MTRTSARKRSRRRFSLELCEPRQLLSAAPVQAPLTEFVASFEVSPLGLGALSLLRAPATNASAVSPAGELTIGAQGQNGFILFDSNAGSIPLGVTNGYGSSNIQLGGTTASSSASDFFGIPRSSVASPLDSTWQAAPSPALDPITVNETIVPPPSLPSPAAAPAPAPVTAPPHATQTTPAPSPALDESSVVPKLTVPLASSAPSTEQAPASKLAGVTAEPAATEAPAHDQRWLPVSFSPMERHQLDASLPGASGVRTIAAREKAAGSSLEPTRAISQTFVVAHAQPAVGNARELAAATTALDGADSQDRAYDRAARGTLLAARDLAIRDASLLDADLAEVPWYELIALVRDNDRTTAARESAVDEGLADVLPETEPHQLDWLSWGQNKQLVGALLAAIAVNVVWSYSARAAVDATEPVAPAPARRKQRERLAR